jgi:hypothetical protein
MPLGVFVPARAEDLALSFASGVDSAAQGSVLFRNGASRYAALAPGTAGQVFTSGGAGANPSWSTPLTDHGALTGLGDDDHAQYVILSPSHETRNTIQATTNTVTPLIIRQQGVSNMTMTEWQDNASAIITQVTKEGWVAVGNVAPAAPLHLRPPVGSNIPQLLMQQENAGANWGLHADSATGNLLFKRTGTTVVTFPPTGTYTFAGGGLTLSGTMTAANYAISPAGGTITMGHANAKLERVVADGHNRYTTQNSPHEFVGSVLVGVSDAATNTITTVETLAHSSTGTPTVGFGGRQLFTLESSTTDNQSALEVEVTWATATHATRKAQAVYKIWDTAARECLRLEASGTAPMIGFLGASSVVRQTVGAASTDLGSVITLANNLRTALINLGLCQT